MNADKQCGSKLCCVSHSPRYEGVCICIGKTSSQQTVAFASDICADDSCTIYSNVELLASSVFSLARQSNLVGESKSSVQCSKLSFMRSWCSRIDEASTSCVSQITQNDFMAIPVSMSIAACYVGLGIHITSKSCKLSSKAAANYKEVTMG
jgi:hypothetical protein